MQEPSAMPKDDLLCNKYNKKDRVFQEYRGFGLASLKLILEYSFSGFVLKIDRNNKQLQFDIHLSKIHKDTQTDIDIIEVEKFRKFYGRGFNLILWSKSDEQYME